MPTRQTRTPIATSTDEMTRKHCDVLIIGAGLAGLSTALSLPKNLNVAVLAKEDLQACSSHYAQGGIAAVIDTNDSVAEHVSDTLIAGDGLCDVAATTQILSQGAAAIDWLLKHNVPFTTDGEGDGLDAALSKHASLADLHLTQEGGHGRRRVAHADDATGKHIMQALHQQAARASNIHIYAYHEALRLLTDNNVCTGAQVVDTQTNTLIEFDCQAVVIASGGLGKLFSRATAPDVCVGDGIMMAWEAGCRLANLEFIQFHPTGLVHSDDQGKQSNFLISEAVRGEGGYLRCPITHERFMPAYDSREELAPRDIVARAISNEISKNKLGYVHLDISHQPAAFVKEHFPDIYAHCLALGIDITTSPIPVAPTAHYTCGGVVTTAEGKTDIKGLYAAGEVANTGLHGANRLASNSLLECVVVGREIAAHIPHYLNNSGDWNRFGELADASAAIAPSQHETTDNPADNTKVTHTSFIVPLTGLLNTRHTENSHSNTHSNLSTDLATIDQLKALMTNNMGIRRSEEALNSALQQVLACKEQHAQQTKSQTRFNLESFRWQRLLTLATLLLQSALTREESRGGHCRNDFPTSNKQPAMSVINPIAPPINPSQHNEDILRQFADCIVVNTDKHHPKAALNPPKSTAPNLAQTA